LREPSRISRAPALHSKGVVKWGDQTPIVLPLLKKALAVYKISDPYQHFQKVNDEQTELEAYT
jgi:hypothetical protein